MRAESIAQKARDEAQAVSRDHRLLIPFGSLRSSSRAPGQTLPSNGLHDLLLLFFREAGGSMKYKIGCALSRCYSKAGRFAVPRSPVLVKWLWELSCGCETHFTD